MSPIRETKAMSFFETAKSIFKAVRMAPEAEPGDGSVGHQEMSEAVMVKLYRELQALEAEHKVSLLNARDLNHQLSEAIDRERDLADEVSMKRRNLSKAMTEYENEYGDEIAVAAEGSVITRGMFSFIRRKLVTDQVLPTNDP